MKLRFFCLIEAHFEFVASLRAQNEPKSRQKITISGQMLPPQQIN